MSTKKLFDFFWVIVTQVFYCIVAFSFIVACWEFCIFIFQPEEYLLPRPIIVFSLLYSDFNYFFRHSFITFVEAFIGFTLGNIVSFIGALILTRYQSLTNIGLTFAVIIKTTPLIALSSLFIIWFGNGYLGKGIMAALVCFFPTFIATLQGLSLVDRARLDYFNSMSTNKWKEIFYLRIPYSIPSVCAALKVTSTISVVGAIVAEMSGANAGIGYILQVSIYQVETARMFAAIMLISIFGLLFYGTVALFTEVIFWRYFPKGDRNTVSFI